ncbi:MAG: NADH-quinone oxidoreductase subunit J [Solirubrobacterales bacterium]
MNVVFYISAVVAIAATILTVTRSNAVHALLYFICSLLATGVMFFVLGAPFVAMLVIIVNAGAIMVLFVFIVMMLNIGPHPTDSERNWLRPRVWIGPALFGVILAVELGYVLVRYETGNAAGQVVGPKEVGIAAFGPYLLGVELASMLLLAALLGAYHLGGGVLQSKGGTI